MSLFNNVQTKILITLLLVSVWLDNTAARTLSVDGGKAGWDAIVGTRRLAVNNTRISAHPANLSTIWNQTQLHSLIAYGRAANPGEFPFATYITDFNIFCSGSLIAPRVAMTAAHCVTTPNGGWSDLQNYVLSIGNVNYAKGQQFGVQSVLTPHFDPNTLFGDIALIELTGASTMQPVTLPGPHVDIHHYKKVITAGWGETQNGAQPYDLRTTELSILSPAVCVQEHKKLGMGNAPPADHFCTGLDPSRTSTCPGDSGSPYLVPGSRHVQIGLVSYGPTIYKCGGKNNVDVPTSIVYWSNWIQDMISMYNLAGTTPPARLNTALLSTCLTGHNLHRAKTSTASRCCEVCRQNQSCMAWTWISSSKLCEIKSVAGKKSTNSNCVSGEMS